MLLSRWSTAFALLGVLACALAGATFIEAKINLQAARTIIYNAWWFFLILLLLIVNFIFIARKAKLIRRKLWGVLLLHGGFIISLAGACITHIWGFDGYMHIRQGQSSNSMMTRQHHVVTLPFSVTLDRFLLNRYPGSDSPSSYQSEVSIRYKDLRQTDIISMNHVAQVGGYRIYQCSFDPDEQGTILSVNHDPVGTATSFTGYGMLIAGMILALFQKGSRFRKLYAQLTNNTRKTGWGIGLLLILVTQTASAGTASAPDKTTASRFGKLLIQSPDGRIEPVGTYARDILRKLYHKDHYHDLNANQVLAGIITQPEFWKKQPLLFIGTHSLPQDIPLAGPYSSFDRMFDAQGNYLLHDVVEKIYAKPPATRSKTEQTLLKLDEKVNILFGLLDGGLLPLFPVAHQQKWISPADTALCRDSTLKREITERFAAWKNAVIRSDSEAAQSAISDLDRYQQNSGITLRPFQIEAELFYNGADIFRWAFRADLILGGLLLITVLAHMCNRIKYKAAKRLFRSLMIAIVVVFILQTFGLVLRGYISGHAPWSNAYESMLLVGWTTLLAGLLFAKKSPLALALGTLLGGVALFVAHLNWIDPQITPLVPVLKSYWLMIHVSVITASYGFFGISAACGIASLTATCAGKNLHELRIINQISMIIGLVLLTCGIFLGAVWANQAWGRYWGWDPKETWALITMILYAIVTHLHAVARTNQNRFLFDVLSVVALASVLMTYFGVNYYLSGLHSYGENAGLSAVIWWGLGGGCAILIVAAALKQFKTNKK